MSEKYIQSKDLAWNRLGDDIIAFSLDGEKEFHHLNPTAAAVFEALQTPQSMSALVARVVKEFDIDELSASTDVQAVITEMRQRKLIVSA